MPKKKRKRLLILGFGNILRKDDGIGVHVVRAIAENYAMPRDAECLEGGTKALSLTVCFKDYTHMIIVDALRGDKPAGSICRVRGPETAGAEPRHVSAHGLGVKEMLLVAGFEGPLPDVLITGMMPEDVSPGLELTPTAEKGIKPFIGMIIKEAKDMGFRINAKETKPRA